MKRLFLVCVIIGLMSLKPVTERMPEPMKTAFSNVRETAINVASGDGIKLPNLSSMRGMWESSGNGGIQHVGGR